MELDTIYFVLICALAVDTPIDIEVEKLQKDKCRFKARTEYIEFNDFENVEQMFHFQTIKQCNKHIF